MEPDNTYELNSAKKIKIAIYERPATAVFKKFLEDHVFESIKISQNFTMNLNIIDQNKDHFSDFNYLFYICDYSEIVNPDNINNELKNILSQISISRNHLFIVIDGCDDLDQDDDGDIIFIDKNKNTIYKKFVDGLGKIENTCSICRILIPLTNAWKKIGNDGSSVNLTDEEINLLSTKLLKNNKKDIADKKKDVRNMIKKIKIDDKLTESGYNEFFEIVSKYFKLINQKRLVCQNYLWEFSRAAISFDTTNIHNIIKEIYKINYLKSDVHDDLTDKIDEILLTKLKDFYQKSRNVVVIESKQLNHIDAYAYHKLLNTYMEMSREYNISKIMDITKQEIMFVDKLIIDQHNKEVEKITDLEKISSMLEIFAKKDKNNLLGLFDKIRSNTKVVVENMEKMDKWVAFVTKCIKLGIPKESIIKLLEEIIMIKISYYSDVSKCNRNELSTIYPQCLQVFLLSNLNKHFILMKLYMLLVYTIRYSGKNIADLIRNIKYDNYKNLMLLENKLLELCSSSTEEQSQKINCSDIEIVETFNEKMDTPDINNNIVVKNIKKVSRTIKRVDDDV